MNSKFWRFSVLVVLTHSFAFAQQTPIRDAVVDSLAITVVDAINRNNFQLADQIIAAQLSRDSTSLEWLFLRGMRYYSEIFVIPGFNKIAVSRMKQSLERAAELGERRLEDRPNDAYTLFYTGGALGYLGIAKMAEGSLFGAVGTAKKGFNMHEDLIELCPECYDAYLGPGMMNLMTSDVPMFLKPILWLFGLNGSEEKAYDYLSTAFHKGRIVRLEGGTYFAQLLERRKECKHSFEVYSQLIQEYPMKVGLRAESMSPLWADKRYDDVISLGGSTMQMFESHEYFLSTSDSSWLPSILMSTSRAYTLKGDTASSVALLEDFINNDSYQAIPKWRMHSSLAGTYLTRNDTAKAVYNYKAILTSTAPDDTKQHAWEMLGKINGAK